ncbi:LOW QUALITY PROTEIN: keratin, type II cytoskeletal 2 oral-like [Herpailurus yagouaroundi]|uniref:LOW QUALITY PROTEIN: keratin, type II cytoskeletal 2 oral-like n=1 Tax=Herpailurus yagouaroundi TaxID=1608482 RepID=UPI001AD6D36F|nr:LOW QUALITY PROTEIN: keratin, type II cytoskeletal 2 oral-like [Puma yagouaroundi]
MERHLNQDIFLCPEKVMSQQSSRLSQATKGSRGRSAVVASSQGCISPTRSHSASRSGGGSASTACAMIGGAFGSQSMNSLGRRRKVSLSVARCAVQAGGSDGKGQWRYGGFGGIPGGSGGLGDSGGFPFSIQEVIINQSLLQPLNMGIDPLDQEGEDQEKEQIKMFNDKFASFADKVWFLEQQNRVLETKWCLLQEQPPISKASTGDLKPFFESYTSCLRAHLDRLLSEWHQLDGAMQSMMQTLVEEYERKYVDEFNKCSEAEDEFTVLKKDVDTSCMTKVDLEIKMESLTSDVNFLKALFEAEYNQVLSESSGMSVILSMDNNWHLDLDSIISEVKAQYEEITQGSKAEAKRLYQVKLGRLQTIASWYGADLRSTKNEIAELKRMVQRLWAKIEGTKKQAEYQPYLLCDCQELMNVKLALDVEIATYQKMLGGEECRIVQTATSSDQSSCIKY